jgi:hypothetical protein
MLFSGNPVYLPFSSTLSVDPTINVHLGGTLDLALDPGTGTPVPSSFKLQLFLWNGAPPAGQHFDQIITPAGYIADTSHLYTDGYVTLTAVPEPAGAVLAALGGFGLLALRRRTRIRSKRG